LMCSAGKFLKILTHFLIFNQNFYMCLQNYLVPGDLSNLSFLPGAEQLICRTHPLASYVDN